MTAFASPIPTRPSPSPFLTYTHTKSPLRPITPNTPRRPHPALPPRILTSAVLVTSPVDNLSPATKRLIKASVPAIKSHAVDIGTHFYHTMFTNYPHFKKQFNIDRQPGGVTKQHGAPAQIVAVTNALINFGTHIDNLPHLARSMQSIFHKHVSRAVTPDQYPAVAESFLTATRVVLGDAISDDVLNAWTKGFAALAQIYIENEDLLRRELEEKAGYSGFVPMLIEGIEDGDRARRITLGGVPLSAGCEGMYVSLYLAELETTMSARIVGSGEKGLIISINKGKEKTSRYLLEKVQVGNSIQVSIPCGAPRS